MMSFTRAVVLRVFPVVVFGLFLCTLVWAQHPVAPPRPTPPMHVYTPPVYHAPMMPTPPVRPPVTYAPTPWPVYRAPGPYGPSYGSSIVLPPVRPIRPIRPPLRWIYVQPIFFGQPFWSAGVLPGNTFCWDANCNWFWPWTPGYASISSPGPANYVMQTAETPVYVYGDEREDFPQLVLKDGTILNVSDYWVVDNQLHFKVVEGAGMKPVEQTIPFDQVDLQRTVDVNTRRGFRFVLRNEPFEQYVRDHPEGPPPPAIPPQQ